MRGLARTALAVSLSLALGAAAEAASSSAGEDAFGEARMSMVEEQIEARGVRDPRVLQALRDTPRHLYVPEALREHAYEDRPLPIGSRQTISQPYIVAYMTELLRPEADDVMLEVGTGSGYQAAVLSRLVKELVSIEILPELAESAKAALAADGRNNVQVVVGDGYRGMPERAPFDGIIVTAAPPEVPEPLVEQLAVGGRMVVPVGDGIQDLVVIEKTERGVTRKSVLPVRFVPMTGEAQSR